ncbi:uncharacterized protein SCHCODRAFT_02089441 [Schizophyllum commune H4-8]|uniref:uncharacterized protein n=1 Tax=Schizophyllum commune (strain H4-8 / FGSC 9210) TaxID=578458 RepID=UPI002160F56B|nr:uncharacterized protein SCHCODRAFT_02089441 [Schizophyllum commune H4-8]KAI5887146.1 hypothetical protein SCHCODRAFT_02089441 [Schizophyllum commune H4-8]
MKAIHQFMAIPSNSNHQPAWLFISASYGHGLPPRYLRADFSPQYSRTPFLRSLSRLATAIAVVLLRLACALSAHVAIVRLLATSLISRRHRPRSSACRSRHAIHTFADSPSTLLVRGSAPSPSCGA